MTIEEKKKEIDVLKKDLQESYEGVVNLVYTDNGVLSEDLRKALIQSFIIKLNLLEAKIETKNALESLPIG